MRKFLHWLHKYEQTKIYPVFEEYFIVGTRKSFWLHHFLLWTNIFLFLIAVTELFSHGHSVFLNYIHYIELFFGILFLFEFILKSIYISIPNTISGGTFMIVNFVVIISLIIPGAFGNLALLRIIRSLKIIKIFYFEKEIEAEKKVIQNNHK